MAAVLEVGDIFKYTDVSLLGERKYDNGTEAEGVVIRAQKNEGYAPISFKVINLNYEGQKIRKVS